MKSLILLISLLAGCGHVCQTSTPPQNLSNFSASDDSIGLVLTASRYPFDIYTCSVDMLVKNRAYRVNYSSYMYGGGLVYADASLFSSGKQLAERSIRFNKDEYINQVAPVTLSDTKNNKWEVSYDRTTDRLQVLIVSDELVKKIVWSNAREKTNCSRQIN